MREPHRERPLRVRPPTSVARRQSVRSSLHDTHHEWWFLRPLPVLISSPRAPARDSAQHVSLAIEPHSDISPRVEQSASFASGDDGNRIVTSLTRRAVGEAGAEPAYLQRSAVDDGGGVQERSHVVHPAGDATDPDVEVSRLPQTGATFPDSCASPRSATGSQSAGRRPPPPRHAISSAASARRPSESSRSDRFRPALLTDDVAAEADEKYPIASLPFLSTRDPGEAISWPSHEAGAASLLESAKKEDSSNARCNHHGSNGGLRGGSSRKNHDLLQANVSPTRRTARVILIDPDVGGLLYDIKNRFVVRFDANDFVLRSSQVSIGEDVTYNRLYETSDVFRAVRLIRQGPAVSSAVSGSTTSASSAAGALDAAGAATSAEHLPTATSGAADSPSAMTAHRQVGSTVVAAGSSLSGVRPARALRDDPDAAHNMLQHSLIGAEYRSLYAKRVSVSHEALTSEAAAEQQQKQTVPAVSDPQRALALPSLARGGTVKSSCNASWLKVMNILQGDALYHTNFVKSICENPSLLAEELDRETEHVVQDAIRESQRQKPPTSIFAGDDTRASDAAVKELFSRWEQSAPSRGKELQSAEAFCGLRQRVRQSCRWYRPKQDWFLNVATSHVAADEEPGGMEQSTLEPGETDPVFDGDDDNADDDGSGEDDRDITAPLFDGDSFTISVPLATPRTATTARAPSPTRSPNKRRARMGATGLPPSSAASISAKWEHERKVLVAERNPRLLTDGVVLENQLSSLPQMLAPVGAPPRGAAIPSPRCIPPHAMIAAGSSTDPQRPTTSAQERPQRPQVWR